MDQYSRDCDRMAAILLLVAAAYMVEYYYKKQPQRRRQHRRRRIQRERERARDEARQAVNRSIWCREWLLRRSVFGDYDHLIDELHREDARGFKNFLRIEPEFFNEMVERVTPILKKQDTNMRRPLSVGLKLAVTLRFLATGNSYASLQYSFRVSKSAISRFVPQVCQAIIDVYQNETLVCPTTPEQWENVASEFSKKWNYHNCIGALDGKHVAMKKPHHGGSLYFNYKKFHSIVLMAVADANYR